MDDGLDFSKFLNKLLVVTSALERVSGDDILRHEIKDASISELITFLPSFLLGHHDKFIQVKEDNI